MSWLWSIPFVLLLLVIALLPLIAPHFWEKNRNKGWVALGLALPIAIYLVIQHPGELPTIAGDYFSFMAILFSLFVVSGGISLTGDLKATPRTNTLFLAVGALLASLIGTTGASMLLIRPLLKTNSERKQVNHLPVFFIFIVSNAGGLLTPIGDPPLFLGYIKGVPFLWSLNLFPVWLLTNSFLLLLFYLIDRRAYGKETRQDLKLDEQNIQPLKITGSFNFILLLFIIAGFFLPFFWRELEMLLVAALSLWLTPKKIRKENRFTFHPIVEVGILFIAIFITMAPPLTLLGNEGSRLGLTQPWQFFWIPGFFSSFLDNAPTYLAFFSLAQGLHLPHAVVAGIPHMILFALSAGTVLMGANTYIGNAPNFMVKAIADETGIKAPSFFGYMGYVLVVLTPIYVLISLIFL